ncbi:hypothetical protein KIH41_02475 [Litoribacter ruber]|uniref:AbiU2 domain-containing protein n=1 Tax=Litoribacter ruber TaxID=702568 RepID=UPI001BD97463|nr:hypothetical protein [Litoribacter ruber]MBT0810146.1 hypothetical protein [Litoribacter ruber]
MDLKDAIEKGIASDLFLSQRHYFVYRSIGEHYNLLDSLEKSSDQELMGYLQSSAQDLCVLHLAKVYDNAHSKYKIRSIKGLLQEAFKLQLTDVIHLKYADNIHCLGKLSDYNLDWDGTIPQIDLLRYLKAVLDSEVIESKVKNLKFARNKYIAHNEHNLSDPGLDSFWDDVRFLQDIASLYLRIIGRHFLGSEYFQFEARGNDHVHFGLFSSVWWVYEQLERVLGKEDLVYWWNGDD